MEIAVEAENAYSEFVENRRKYSNYTGKKYNPDFEKSKE